MNVYVHVANLIRYKMSFSMFVPRKSLTVNAIPIPMAYDAFLQVCTIHKRFILDKVRFTLGANRYTKPSFET